MGRYKNYVTIASLILAGAFALAAYAAPQPHFADTSATAMPVDVELVLAVDVSYSMDPDEQALQREGYVQALTSKEFMQALREGTHAKVAITYIEWAGQFDQKVIMPWRLIEGPEFGRRRRGRACRRALSARLAYLDLRRPALRQDFVRQ